MKLFLLSTALLFSLYSCDTATQAPHIAQWKIHDYYSVYSDISIPDHKKEVANTMMKEEERKMSFYELDLRNDSTFTFKEPNNYNNRKPLVSEGTYTLNDSNLVLHTKKSYYIGMSGRTMHINQPTTRKFTFKILHELTKEVKLLFKDWDDGVMLTEQKEGAMTLYFKK